MSRLQDMKCGLGRWPAQLKLRRMAVMVQVSYHCLFATQCSSCALQRFSMLCLKWQVNVGDPEYLGVTHVMRISCPPPCSYTCCFCFRQKLLLWLQERLQAWVFWVVLLMWSNCQVVASQSLTEGLSCSKHVSRHQRQDCEQESQEQLSVPSFHSCFRGAGPINRHSQISLQCVIGIVFRQRSQV